jgi:thiamine transporter
MEKKSNVKLRALTEGAVMVALAQVLGYIKLFELPQGGSICLSMLPIFIYCARWGFSKGMLASFAFSLLQLLLDGAYAWGWQSMIGDYIVAFTVLGFAGLFHKMKYGFYVGTVVGSVARFLGMTMTNPWFYSLLYNGSYMVLNMIMCLIVGALLWKPMGKYIRGEDLDKA